MEASLVFAIILICGLIFIYTNSRASFSGVSPQITAANAAIGKSIPWTTLPNGQRIMRGVRI